MRRIAAKFVTLQFTQGHKKHITGNGWSQIHPEQKKKNQYK